MMENLKALAAWVWHWITLLVALIVGALSTGVEYLDQIVGMDLTQIMTKEHAAEVVFWTAVAKMVVTIYNTWKARQG